MEDIVLALWKAQNSSSAVGKVITGLGVLCTRYDELWLIVEGQGADRVKASDIGISLGGIIIGGRLLVPFCDVKPLERDSGEPCVSFEMSGKEAMFAPAMAPDDDRYIKEVDFLLNRDWYDGDHVYIHDLDGSCARRSEMKDGEDEVVLLRRSDLEIPEKGLLPTDILRILGEDMRLGEITWMERENDGDGNRYGHIVMMDGRYRRIAFGDLGR